MKYLNLILQIIFTTLNKTLFNYVLLYLTDYFPSVGVGVDVRGCF